MSNQKNTGAGALCQAMLDLSIDTVFGIVGHGNLALIDALSDFPQLDFISTYHEQIAVHAADSYFRTSHRVSVVTTTVGPGATNIVTGLADALLDTSALVAITSGVPSDYSNRDSLQALSVNTDDSQSEIFRPVCKRVIVVKRAEELVPLFIRAIHLATSGTPGPVVLHVPMDFYSAEVTLADTKNLRPDVSRPYPSPDSIAKALGSLEKAKRPLILAGGGVSRSEAWGALEAFATRNSIPVATTMSGQGSMPARHALHLGTIGVVGTEPGNSALKDSDCIVAIGTQFPEMDSHSWDERYFPSSETSTIIHIDIEPSRFYRSVKPTFAIQSDAKNALTALNNLPSLAPKSKWLTNLADIKRDWEVKKKEIQESTIFPFEPAALLVRLRKVIPDDSVFVSGVGVRHAVAQHYETLKPGTLIVGSGFGTMGQEVAAPIGSAMANKNSTHIFAIVGDGALLANVQALAVAASYGLKVIWIVLDNGGYGSIAVYQKKHFKRLHATLFTEENQDRFEPDYIGLSISLGVPAVRLKSTSELEEKVEESLRINGPSLIVVPVTETPRNLGSGFWVVNDILARSHN